MRAGRRSVGGREDDDDDEVDRGSGDLGLSGSCCEGSSGPRNTTTDPQCPPPPNGPEPSSPEPCGAGGTAPAAAWPCPGGRACKEDGTGGVRRVPSMAVPRGRPCLVRTRHARRRASTREGAARGRPTPPRDTEAHRHGDQAGAPARFVRARAPSGPSPGRTWSREGTRWAAVTRSRMRSPGG